MITNPLTDESAAKQRLKRKGFITTNQSEIWPRQRRAPRGKFAGGGLLWGDGMSE